MTILQDWRIWLEKNGNPISFWHDIPLYPNDNDTSIINMYVEIPRWTDGKIETSRKEPLSTLMTSPAPIDDSTLILDGVMLDPIFHDEKKGKPRFVFSVWPHRTYPFNYGSIAQTWEDSTVKHNFTGYPGDNDPMDVFDMSSIE